MKTIRFETIGWKLGVSAAGLMFLLFAGCGPKGSSAITAADRYFAAGEYEKAEIEYKNALQAKKQPDVHAIGRLGVIYYEQGRIRQSVPYLLKAKELETKDLGVRAKIATIHLLMGKPKEARDEATLILSRDPANETAPSLLVQASSASPSEVAAAADALKHLPGSAAEGAPVLVALGYIELAKKNIPGAEAFLTRAVASAPRSHVAQSAIASLYLMQNKRPEAEKALQTAAEIAPIRSGRINQLAQFKVQSGDLQGARKILEELANKVPDYLPASSMLAEIAATEKRFDDSLTILGKVLAKDPSQPDAALLSARIRLARKEYAKAAEEMEAMIKTYPSSPQAFYFLGLAYAGTGDKLKATDRLGQAIKLSPMPDAILALAELNLRSGDYSAVVLSLKPFVDKYKDNLNAKLMLAEAYRAQGRTDEALSLYSRSGQQFLQNPQFSFQTGLILLQQKKWAEAQAAFTEALRRDLGFTPALEQLVNVDLATKNFDAALARIAEQKNRDTKSPMGNLLAAKVYLAKKEASLAEAELKKAIELQPELLAGYIMLAQLYTATNQQDKALQSLRDIVARNPKDTGALLMTGMIEDQRKRYSEARKAYETVLSLDPKSSVALNNLAYLHSEKFKDLDKGLELAQRARELLPNEPRAADTLGWIFFQKAQYSRALPILEESAAALPNEAEVQYHLGSARYALGLNEAARTAFNRALELNASIASAEEIRARLNVLSLANDSSSDTVRIAALQKILTDYPNDGAALNQLGAAQERTGLIEPAIQTYIRASQLNPLSATPHVGLARIYSSQNDDSKAMEEAKTARKLASGGDVASSRALGRVALKAGEASWAASLLQEALRSEPDNASLQVETAEAVYRIGQVDQAKELLTEAAAQKGTDGTGRTAVDREKAARLLTLMTFATRPDTKAVEQVAAVAAIEPQNLPSLMALGRIKESAGDAKAARAIYEKALETAPLFTPAKHRLAVLSATAGDSEPKALEWAQQARTAYPSDPEVARTLGILTIQRSGDAQRAIGLIRQSLESAPNDSEALYFLGIAQLKTNSTALAKTNLQKALDLNLRPDLAAAAKKALQGK